MGARAQLRADHPAWDPNRLQRELAEQRAQIPTGPPGTEGLTQQQLDNMAAHNALMAAGGPAPPAPGVIDNGNEADAVQDAAQDRQDWRERNARSIIEAELLNSSTNFYTDGATEFDSWLTENYLPQMQANFFGGGYDPTSVSSPITGSINQQEARRQFLNRPDMQRQPNAMQQSTGRWSWWD
jgi:hypothetical protein